LTTAIYYIKQPVYRKVLQRERYYKLVQRPEKDNIFYTKAVDDDLAGEKQ
jgi:hypothetical protein